MEMMYTSTLVETQLLSLCCWIWMKLAMLLSSVLLVNFERAFKFWAGLQETRSTTRTKGESQNGCFKKTKHPKFSMCMVCVCTCAYQKVRNVRLSENLACFVFLKHPFWYSPFCLITDEISLLSFILKINTKVTFQYQWKTWVFLH